MVEQLFSHLLKVINICAHVLDDVAPGPAIKVTSSSGQLMYSSFNGCGSLGHLSLEVFSLFSLSLSLSL